MLHISSALLSLLYGTVIAVTADTDLSLQITYSKPKGGYLPSVEHGALMRKLISFLFFSFFLGMFPVKSFGFLLESRGKVFWSTIN